MHSSWSVEIATEGGFTGRGVGSASVSSQGASTAVANAVTAAAPQEWRSAYRPAGNPRGYADQVLYRLTLMRDGRMHSTSWYDASRPDLPPDLAALFDAVWTTR